MSKLVALKTFSGAEGHVRRGAILDPADYPSLTKVRIDSLRSNKLIAPAGSDEARGVRERRGGGRQPAPGVDSVNAGGMTQLGWDPAKDHAERVRAIGERKADAVGNEDGAHPADVPPGVSTSPIASLSSSRPAPPPARATSERSNGERPKRGSRRSS